MIATYLALLISGLPGERTDIDVAALVNEAEECKSQSYGGHTFVGCDIAPAMERAVSLCRSQLDVYDTASMPCNYDVPLGLWFWTKKVDVCAGRINFHGSRVRTSFITPIRFPGHGYCQSIGWPQGSPDVGISDVDLEPLGSIPVGTLVYGLEVSKPARIDRVKVRRFTQGIRIIGWADAPIPAEKSNANGFHLTDVSIAESQHTGIWIDGPDTNVGLIERSRVTRSCDDAVELAALGACADIVDGSFLGITLIATNTGYAQDHYPLGPVYPGYILGDSANSRSVCVGCYAEGGYENSVAAENTNVLGGIAAWDGTGGVIQGYQMQSLEITNGDNTAKVSFGKKATSAGTAMMITPIGFSIVTQPLRFKMNAATNSMLIDVANLGTAQALRIGMNANAVGGAGGLYLRPNNTLPSVYLNTTSRSVQDKPAP